MTCEDRLYGAEELAWDHCKVPVSLIYHVYIVFSVIFLCLAAWTASYELPLDTNNFEEYIEEITHERSKYSNGTLYMSEVIESLHAGHPLHMLYKNSMLRYEYGSTYFNYCELRKQPRRSLPSLLRVMEMKIGPQTCLRIIVLAGLHIKMIMIMAQSNTRYLLLGERRILWYLSRFPPLLEITATSFLMLILCLQQDQDKGSSTHEDVEQCSEKTTEEDVY
ncbi:hypothetical protein RB195_000538 [Necator americanus]|uniref:Uncharacterized protein n=1 Tax=Necator americanus TaxID=51031 RepID=A0ABR1DAT8_NECAM